MLKFLLNLFSVSFLLNFVWEMTQMPLYGEAGMGTRDYASMLRIHWEVTFKDALMVLAVYLLIALILRNWRWAKAGFYSKGWLILWLALPAWQGIVEYYSAYVYNRWEYSNLMPLLLGIGIAPLLQMLALPTIAILLSRHFLISNSRE